MRTSKAGLRAAGVALAAASFLFAGEAVAQAPAARIVSVGGANTEVVWALGAGAEVVGVDATSLYPPAVMTLPRVGYHRQLSAEGLLSLNPSLVIAADDSGPPAALDALASAGVKVVRVSGEKSLEGTRKRIRQIAAALHAEARARSLLRDIDAAASALQQRLAAVKKRPKVLFIYARGRGALNVAGRDTAAAAIIALARGQNAIDGYEDYKPLGAESAIAAAPDVILIPDRGLASVGGTEGLLSLPGLAQTPAGEAARVVAMDDLLLLGFGPRVIEGAEALARALHPELFQ